MKGNPAACSFQESVQFGAQNYDDNFRPGFGKVREVLEALPVAHMEVDEVVIPSWKCGEVEKCFRLKENISKKKDYPHSMLAYIFLSSKFIVNLCYQIICQCLIQSWWQFRRLFSGWRVGLHFSM